jgi:uncharacterized lipoprotein YmbA
MTHANRLVLLVLLLVAGCSFLVPRPDPTRFLVLTTTAKGPSGPPTGLTIGLGPVTVPPYLERPEIMTRVAENELRPSPVDRWAAPVGTQIARTLSHDLTALLGLDRVVLHPWYSTADFAAVVEVDVYRFEITSDGKALLVARWRVRPAKGGLRSNTFVRTETAAGDVEAAVGAMSLAVEGLAAEIAGAVREASARR